MYQLLMEILGSTIISSGPIDSAIVIYVIYKYLINHVGHILL